MAINAKEELTQALTDSGKTTADISYGRIKDASCYFDEEPKFNILVTTNFDLNLLDFTYSNGYGGQELEGLIVFTDNTWLSRGEYDGSEWWDYNKCPSIKDITNL